MLGSNSPLLSSYIDSFVFYWVSGPSFQATSTPHANDLLTLLGSDTVLRCSPILGCSVHPFLVLTQYSLPLFCVRMLFLFCLRQPALLPLLLPLSLVIYLTPLGLCHSALDSSSVWTYFQPCLCLQPLPCLAPAAWTSLSCSDTMQVGSFPVQMPPLPYWPLNPCSWAPQLPLISGLDASHVLPY